MHFQLLLLLLARSGSGFDFGNIFEQAFGGGFQFNVGGGGRGVPRVCANLQVFQT